MFWRDPWLQGRAFADLMPELFKFCTMRNLTVAQALTDGKWMRHFRRDLSVQALHQFIKLHDMVENIQLREETQDTVTWRWTANGVYSASSAYELQFEGSTRFNYRDLIWSSDAPLKCRIFGWLALRGKCHTADCLAKKGWPHNAACVLCLSEPETALHLLATCNVAIRLWKKLLTTAALPAALAPSAATTSLDAWLCSSRQTQPAALKKSWTSLVHLTWWTLWKERNSRIFQNSAATLDRMHSCIVEDAKLWRDAGKPRVLDLLHRPREPD